MNKQSVFISYSHRDADLAKRFEGTLKSLGFKAFTEREVRPGEDWRKSIQAAIKQSDALIMLVVSPQRASSSWMSYEAGMAEALGKRVMVLLSNKYPVTELPVDVASSHVVDFDPEAPERAAHDIAAQLAMV
ncbi:MAG TPA: toll/interleukin-1 receptor domain-containing protein [Rhizomicrobium sp.]|jgi:nucleoside 2-deoxyribosyltransferase